MSDYSTSEAPSPPPSNETPVCPRAQEPYPQRKPRRRLLTCLVLVCLLAASALVGAVALNAVLSVFWDAPPVLRGGSSIGVVRVETVIGDPRSTSELLHIIDVYRKAADIRAVLVVIDSPGGAVGASQEIYDALCSLRGDGKVVVAAMGNTGASGGYYVACGADEIYTNPGTLTGSIGVIMGMPNIAELNKKLGISYESVKSGKFKDIGAMTRAMTAEEKKLLENVIADVHDQFVEAILTQRHAQIARALADLPVVDPEVAKELEAAPSAETFLRHIADGRLLTGRQALNYGLVDTLGGREAAFLRAAELAGIEDPMPYEYRPKRTLSDLLRVSAGAALEKTGVHLRGIRLEYRIPY